MFNMYFLLRYEIINKDDISYREFNKNIGKNIRYI